MNDWCSFDAVGDSSCIDVVKSVSCCVDVVNVICCCVDIVIVERVVVGCMEANVSVVWSEFAGTSAVTVEGSKSEDDMVDRSDVSEV